jgi:predicted phage terminase large subunit-like protein
LKRDYVRLLQEQERRLVRRDLGAWSTKALVPQGQKPAAHHWLLIRELELVAAGVTPKLMVLMPPGSAKTTYGSYLFPPWAMIPGGLKVIAASHTIDRAAYVSKQVQRYIRDNRRDLGYGLRNDAVEQWATTNDGEYLAAGVGMAIAGFRADLGMIDDPVKGQEAADSPAMQQKVWDWYWGDFFTRLKPGARQILIMTRWAEGDLGGRLEEAEGDEWKIVRLPAIAGANDPLGRTPGEFLWADDEYGFGAKLKADHASYTKAGRTRQWSALYQQQPSPESGNYFLKEWIKPSPIPPRAGLKVFGASDYAVTADGGDYTVHVVLGIDADGRLYLLDLWRGQTASDQWVEAFCDLVIQWKPMGWAEETGQIRAGIGPFLDRRCRERRAFVARTQFPTRGDKAVRAQSIRGRMALSGLLIPPDAPWRLDFEAEMMGFPAGKHDDQVDALGLVGQLLDVMVPPSRPKPAAPTAPSDYRSNRIPRASRDWRVG